MIISVIGTGNMGQALIAGFLEKQIVKPEEIRICDLDEEKVNSLAKKTGCSPFTSAKAAVIDATYVLLAVKPQVIDSVISSFVNELSEKTIIISIAASVKISRLRSCLKLDTPIIRVMPNTPALVGAGVSAVCSDLVPNDKLSFVYSLLESCGIVIPCTEKELDAIGCVSGTGPAYLMLVIEALADSAVKLGISRDNALKIASYTVYGSGKLAADTGTHPAVLKDQVCSPNGTTIEGVLALEKNGIRSAIEEAVIAADNKTKLLAGGK